MTDEKSLSSASNNASAPARPPSPEQQWQLALAHLAVSDRAANLLRALLFIAAVALFAFAFSMLRPGLRGPSLWAHGLSLLLCAAAIGSVVKGFRLQSEQSLERFGLLKDGNLEGLAQHDSVVEQLRGRQSGTWNRIAIWLLTAAVLIEIFVRLTFAGTAIHV